MSERRITDAEFPAGSLPVGSASMRDGRPVMLVMLPTGVIVPVIAGRRRSKRR